MKFIMCILNKKNNKKNPFHIIRGTYRPPLFGNVNRNIVIYLETRLVNIWLLAADNDSGHCDKRKINSLCGLRSTIANLEGAMCSFEKKIKTIYGSFR